MGEKGGAPLDSFLNITDQQQLDANPVAGGVCSPNDNEDPKGGKGGGKGKGGKKSQ